MFPKAPTCVKLRRRERQGREQHAVHILNQRRHLRASDANDVPEKSAAST
jgi:hypothetical protein